MKLNTLPIIVMILTSIMVLPVGLSYAQVSNGTMTNQTSSNGTMTMSSNSTNANQTMTTSSSNSTSMNSTMTMPSSNSTSTVNQTMTTTAVPSANDTQSAMNVSTFIHQAVADFAKQGDDTRKVIFDCRDQIQSAAATDVDSIKNGCATQLNAIKAQYQDERSHYHDLIKQYRSSVMIFLNDARGQSVPQATMTSAIAQLAMMMNPVSSPVTGQAATVNNTQCVNPPGGPAIC